MVDKTDKPNSSGLDRDEKGRFLKGNKVKTGHKMTGEMKFLRNATKSEIFDCAASLTLPMSTIKEESADKSISRLRYLTLSAISKRQYKFIQWLLEMAVGKPYSSDPDDDDIKGEKVITLRYSINKKEKENGQTEERKKPGRPKGSKGRKVK